MKLIFNKITTIDFPFLLKLYRSTREKELSLLNMTEDQKSKFIEFQFNAQHVYYTNNYPDAEFDLIIQDKKPIGRLYVLRSEKEIRIIDISLLPEVRGKGIGSEILRSIIQESEKSGKRLTLHVEHFNPALNLYERFGFLKAEDTGVYYFMERLPMNYLQDKKK